MKTIWQCVLLLLALACAGCAHTSKIAARLYVPIRCIEKVSWTRPCATISDHLVKCDGVMVTTSCVSSRAVQSDLEHKNTSGPN
ncbi:MAG TPA: hypothetical protein VJN48_06855 [Terriglobales bacterium]|nr:hypothetical protein [Terriglobales bacterium]